MFWKKVVAAKEVTFDFNNSNKKKKKCVFFESIHDNSHLPKTFTRYCMLYSMYEVSALDAQRSRYQLTTETCVLGQDA